MKKFFKYCLVMVLSPISLLANETLMIEPEVGIKIINSKDTTFLSMSRDRYGITESKVMDIKTLSDVDIVGKMGCEPFYICPNKIKKYMESQGINNHQKLILYDNQYGINASTFYMVLESIGDKKSKILRGGVDSIRKLDPNQKTYDKYLKEKILFFLQEKNATKEEKLEVDIESLNSKLAVLKPLLLVKESPSRGGKSHASRYTIDKRNFNLNYLIGRDSLREVVERVREEGKKSNSVVLDSCSMVDIVGNSDGSYRPGVYSIDWKEIADVKKKGLKSKELLEEIFENAGLKKRNDIFVYCMAGAPKAFYMTVALREAGYKKVKVFTGDWNVWTGDMVE